MSKWGVKTLIRLITLIAFYKTLLKFEHLSHHCEFFCQIFVKFLMRKKSKPFFKTHDLFSIDPRLFTHDPRLLTHDPRLFTHDPRLFTHDPRLLASPIKYAIKSNDTFQVYHLKIPSGRLNIQTYTYTDKLNRKCIHCIIVL